MRTLDQLLGELAVPGVDPAAVSEYVVGGLNAHRRNRRFAAGAAALLVVLGGGTALAFTGGTTPDEVVADRKAAKSVEGSSTDVTEPTTPAVAGETTASTPPPSAPIVTTTTLRLPVAAPGRLSYNAPAAPVPVEPVAPPASTDTTTSSTTVPDQPLQATIAMVTPSVAVGDVVHVTVNWTDPDLPADAQPVATFSFGDPNVGAAASDTAASATCTGGGSRSGVLDGWARYTAPGARTVTVAVSSCGRILNLTAPVTVTPAMVDGQPGRPVVLQVAPGGIDPESAMATWQPQDGGAPKDLPERQPGVTLRSGTGQVPSTVIVLPKGSKGTVRLTSGTSCLQQQVDLSADPASADPVIVGLNAACTPP